jgi:MATE family multidrug resistance protein
MNRDIFKLALPNIITNITVPLLGLVDMALMGHLDNPAYIGAIAIGSIIFNIIYTAFGFLRMGTTGFTAQFVGSENKKGISQTLWRSLLVALSIAFLLLIFQKPIEIFSFFILDGSNEVKDLAKEYFNIRIWAAPATLGLYALYGWFLGMQDAKTPMIIAIGINIINIVLNFIFVYIFKMTSEGVALATLIAQYSGFILALSIMLTKYKKLSLWQPIKELINPAEISKFFKVNGDIFIRTLSVMLVFSLFTSMSASMGDKILATNSLLIQFLFLFSYFADGFAYAGEALTGKAYGSSRTDLLRKTVGSLFNWAWGASLLFSGIYLIASKQIISLLTNNPVLIEMAFNFRWWVIIMPITTIAAFIWDGIFIGLTASKQMRNVMLISVFVVFLPSYFISQSYFGNHSLWFAMNLFMASRSLLMWRASRKLIS